MALLLTLLAFYISAPNNEELDAWISAIRKTAGGGPSSPTNVTHRVHVTFDSSSGAFVGLTPELQQLLNSSGITKDELQANPQAALEVLKFQDRKQTTLAAPVILPKVESTLKLDDLVPKDDPRKVRFPSFPIWLISI